MLKNETKEGIVQSIGMNGEGILREEGSTVFVPFSITGEKIRYKILKAGSGVAYGKVLEVMTPAEERVRPKCPVFGKCGGCQLQHLRYMDQLKIKEENVKTCFRKIAQLNVDVKPTVKGDDEFGYRNNLQLPVSLDKEGNTVIGFYAENSHRVVPISDCAINAVWTSDVILALKDYMEQTGLIGYDEETKSGQIREITVKEVKYNLIITIVSVLNELPREDLLINAFKNRVKFRFSLFHNFNDGDTNVIYGGKFKLIYGEKDYAGDMLGVKYRIGVRSFMQVNDCVCAKLYSNVNAICDEDETSTVINAYSGAGLLTVLLAKRAKRVISVECVAEAVELANVLSEQNGVVDKVTNYLGKCEDILPDVIASERKSGNKITLILDPPRKGCDLKVINSIIDAKPEKIIYVSCKPSTLARDVGLVVGTLEYNGKEIKKAESFSPRYSVTYLKTFDMFAQTKHVETLCVLTLN